jgi:hypothetical protein
MAGILPDSSYANRRNWVTRPPRALHPAAPPLRRSAAPPVSSDSGRHHRSTNDLSAGWIAWYNIIKMHSDPLQRRDRLKITFIFVRLVSAPAASAASLEKPTARSMVSGNRRCDLPPLSSLSPQPCQGSSAINSRSTSDALPRAGEWINQRRSRTHRKYIFFRPKIRSISCLFCTAEGRAQAAPLSSARRREEVGRSFNRSGKIDQTHGLFNTTHRQGGNTQKSFSLVGQISFGNGGQGPPPALGSAEVKESPPIGNGFQSANNGSDKQTQT